MGLTIHYAMGLPGQCAESEALERLEQLRDFAHAHALTVATPIVRLSKSELSIRHRKHSLEWALRILEEVMHDEVSDPYDGDDLTDLGIAGFAVNAGEGCEPAFFGLAAPMPEGLFEPNEDLLPKTDWHWEAYCKTVYASEVSVEHFVHCHRTVCDILDEAERLGFVVSARDEGEYWETRSVERLLKYVQS